jgi:hypothetical protein
VKQDPDVSKRDLFDVLVQWRDCVMEELEHLKYTSPQEIDGIVGKWQLETRLKGRQLTLPKGNMYMCSSGYKDFYTYTCFERCH